MAEVGDNIAVPLDDWRAGSTPSARHWNQPVKVLRGLTKGVTPPGQVVLSGSAAVAAAAGVAVKQYTLFSQGWDYFNAYDKSGESWVLVKIAKPYLLRPTQNARRSTILYEYPVGVGEQRTGTGNVGGSTVIESQTIIPRYIRDDLVYAATLPKSVIGPIFVETPPVDELGEPIPEDVTLLDMNVDGRAWAATYAGTP